jgi:tetratricopeptide (TPR) repeat protein
MSSLLDLLQKKAAPPAAAQETNAPAPAASHMQTVELHLAVDNRGMGEQPVAPDPVPEAATDIRIAVQDEDPAWGQIAAEAAPTVAPTAAAADAAAEASQSLLLSQRRLRVRRNTSLLIGSLVLILLAVTTAISIVMQYAADRDGAQAVVIPPEAVTSAPAQQVAGDAAGQPAVRPLRKEVTSMQAAVTPKAAARKDPDWYDSPAVEPQGNTAEITISRGTSDNPLFPKLSTAWNALQAADYPAAESLYREVRAADATNVDAMLGLAAIALRTGRDQEAQALYNEVLAAEPKNPAAIAALSALPAGASATGDTGNETRLKNLLREQPAAAELHFALGLQYVGGGRWPEAQQAFFDAVRNEPTNADYAYNLAVSLDQLGQASAAAAYYERALTLVGGSTLFDTTAARQRLDSLRAAAP